MTQTKYNAVKQIFRSIVRTAKFIDNSHLNNEISFLKNILRKKISSLDTRMWRKKLTQLLEIEQSVRQISEGKLTVAQLRETWNPNALKPQLERNQEGRIQPWLQHAARRFDKYNAPPSPNTQESAKVHRMAQFASTTQAFCRQFGLPQNSIAVQAILAPYWKAAYRTRIVELRPRPVEVRSIKRDSGVLSILRVRGRRMRGRGLRRHIEDINVDRRGRVTELKSQKWLAQQYSQDTFDGEDMSDWIGHITAEIRSMNRKIVQTNLKYEVHRRILLRRKAELERDYEWRYRQQIQTRDRLNKRNPKPLWTLETL